MRFFVCTVTTLRGRMRRGASIYCRRCGVELAVGDEAVSYKTGHAGKHCKIYHASCHRTLFVEAESDV